MRKLSLALALLLAPPARGAELRILNKNQPGEGFNDPTPVAPAGLNFGSTRGQQALIAFQFAATIWGATLRSAAPILVDSALVTVDEDSRLQCTATSGIIGFARATSSLSGDGFPNPNAAYPAALAGALTGRDATPGDAHIMARLNGSVGTAGCLQSQSWYYGLDGNEALNQDDMVTVLLHELGHGLGFISFVDPNTGSLGDGPPSIFDFHAWDLSADRSWAAESDAVRKLLASSASELGFDGPALAAGVPRFLDFLPELDIGAIGLPSPVPVAQADFSAPFSGGGAVTPAEPIDACGGLTNGPELAGRVALIQRSRPDGGPVCRFYDKALAAEDAGATGVIFFNYLPGAALVRPTGSPPLSIPVAFVSLESGTAIQARATAGTVTAAFGTSALRAGVDPSGARVLLYTPPAVVSASSVSHFDTTASPALLMEPRILRSFSQNLDLTPAVMSDLGWSVVQGLSVAVAKALDQTITPGGEATYLVTLVNRRTEATEATLDLQLPDGAAVVSSAGACTTAVFPCELGQIGAGEVKLTMVTVRVPARPLNPFVVFAQLIPATSSGDDVLLGSTSLPLAGTGSGCSSAGGPASALALVGLLLALGGRALRRRG